MSSLTHEQVVQYISELEVSLPEVQPHAPPAKLAAALTAAAAEPGSTAAVAASGLQGFLPDVTAQQQQDVLNSTLLAQLAAYKAAKGGPETSPDVYFNKYREVLSNIGWSIQSFHLSKINVSQYNDASDLVLQLASNYLDANELSLLKTSVSAITNPSNTGPYGIFNSSAISSSNNSTGFSVGVVSQYQGNPTFKINWNTYSVNTSIRDYGCLWFYWGSDSSLNVDFKAGNQAMTLNSALYSNWRQTVIDKLGKNVKDYIGGLDI